MRSLLLVLAVLLVAGCSQPADESPPPAATPDSADASLAWSATGCHQVGANIQVLADRLQQRLPPGFTLASGQAGLTVLGIEAFECAQMTVGDRTAPTGYATVWTPVSPPGDLAIEGRRHYYRWEILLGDGALAQEIAAHVAGVSGGSVAITPGDGQASMHAASIAFDGLGQVRIDGLATQDLGAFSYGFADIVSGHDGTHAAWPATLEAHTFHQGSGVVTLPAGSWLAEVAGAERVAAQTWSSSLDLVDGTITWP